MSDRYGELMIDGEQAVITVEDGVVRYELARDGECPVLTFSHCGLGVRNAKEFTPGTHAFLDRLESHLAGTSLPSWSERYQQVALRY